MHTAFTPSHFHLHTRHLSVHATCSNCAARSAWRRCAPPLLRSWRTWSRAWAPRWRPPRCGCVVALLRAAAHLFHLSSCMCVHMASACSGGKCACVLACGLGGAMAHVPLCAHLLSGGAGMSGAAICTSAACTMPDARADLSRRARPRGRRPPSTCTRNSRCPWRSGRSTRSSESPTRWVRARLNPLAVCTRCVLSLSSSVYSPCRRARMKQVTARGCAPWDPQLQLKNRAGQLPPTPRHVLRRVPPTHLYNHPRTHPPTGPSPSPPTPTTGLQDALFQRGSAHLWLLHRPRRRRCPERAHMRGKGTCSFAGLLNCRR